MKKLWLVVFLVMAVSVIASSLFAEQDWRKEFDSICAISEEAMTLKAEDLQDLIVRCEKLKPVLEGIEDPQKKIFLKRLEKCRNLFQYLLEVREQEKK